MLNQRLLTSVKDCCYRGCASPGGKDNVIFDPTDGCFDLLSNVPDAPASHYDDRRRKKRSTAFSEITCADVPTCSRTGDLVS